MLLRVSPRPSRQDAIEQVRLFINPPRSCEWAIEGDVEDCFGSIHQGLLLEQLRRRMTDKRVLRLMRQFLAAGVVRHGSLTSTPSSTPQGAILRGEPKAIGAIRHDLLAAYYHMTRSHSGSSAPTGDASATPSSTAPDDSSANSKRSATPSRSNNSQNQKQTKPLNRPNPRPSTRTYSPRKRLLPESDRQLGDSQDSF